MPLPTQIESLFDRHPELSGFSVRGSAEVPDNCPRGDEDCQLFVGDIGLTSTLTRDQFGAMFEEIVVALAEVIAEDPQAEELLRGRTFARVLH